MAALAPLPEGAFVAMTAHNEAVESLRAGEPFSFVLAEDSGLRAAMLEAAMGAMADLSTRFIRVGNPLRSPLTIERLAIQASGSDTEIVYEEDSAALIRRIAPRKSDETRVILVIEQAETLDPGAMRALRAMSHLFRQNVPALQVLFAGSPSFRAMLDTDAPSPQRWPSAAPAAAVPSAPPPLPEPTLSPQAAALLRRGRPFAPMKGKSTARRALWLALPVGALALAGGMAWVAEPALFAPALDTTNPAYSAPPEAVPAPAAPPPPRAPGPPGPEDAARLRPEFDAFLASSGQNVARLTEAQRDALLQEFLAWRARGQGTPPPR